MMRERVTRAGIQHGKGETADPSTTASPPVGITILWQEADTVPLPLFRSLQNCHPDRKRSRSGGICCFSCGHEAFFVFTSLRENQCSGAEQWRPPFYVLLNVMS